MISVEEALSKVLEHPFFPPPVQVPLENATSRILADDVLADSDLPPYDRVAMDGIALRTKDLLDGTRQYESTGFQRAGQPPLSLPAGAMCIEVATGAVLPKGCDCVVPYEQCSRAGESFTVEATETKKFQNVHRKGVDKKKGDLLLKRGTRISTPEVAILASVGAETCTVCSLPRTIIITTGDELVPVDEQPLAWQIRQSNGFMLSAILGRWGIKADYMHLPDNENLLRAKLSQVLAHYELVLLSGGVSKGRLDLLPQLLEEAGVHCVFHKVKQKPGKPFWFGHSTMCTVFAFPGNPTSTMVCALKYLEPWLCKSFSTLPPLMHRAVLASTVKKKPGLTTYIPAALSYLNDRLTAHPVVNHGSGDFASLAAADVFLELPPENEQCAAGETYPCLPLR